MIEKKTFSIICDNCDYLIPNTKLGINSYGEYTCPRCNHSFYVKTDSKGGKTQNPLTTFTKRKINISSGLLR